MLVAKNLFLVAKNLANNNNSKKVDEENIHPENSKNSSDLATAKDIESNSTNLATLRQKQKNQPRIHRDFNNNITKVNFSTGTELTVMWNNDDYSPNNNKRGNFALPTDDDDENQILLNNVTDDSSPNLPGGENVKKQSSKNRSNSKIHEVGFAALSAAGSKTSRTKKICMYLIATIIIVVIVGVALKCLGLTKKQKKNMPVAEEMKKEIEASKIKDDDKAAAAAGAAVGAAVVANNVADIKENKENIKDAASAKDEGDKNVKKEETTSKKDDDSVSKKDTDKKEYKGVVSPFAKEQEDNEDDRNKKIEENKLKEAESKSLPDDHPALEPIDVITIDDERPIDTEPITDILEYMCKGVEVPVFHKESEKDMHYKVYMIPLDAQHQSTVTRECFDYFKDSFKESGNGFVWGNFEKTVDITPTSEAFFTESIHDPSSFDGAHEWPPHLLSF